MRVVQISISNLGSMILIHQIILKLPHFEVLLQISINELDVKYYQIIHAVEYECVGFNCFLPSSA